MKIARRRNEWNEKKEERSTETMVGWNDGKSGKYKVQKQEEKN
jgi:hypothetical protein